MCLRCRDYQRGRTTGAHPFQGIAGPEWMRSAMPCQMAYNLASMTVLVRSFAKINLGLRIGAVREDGFHELLTVYQTIGLHDVIHVSLSRGSGIEIHCDDPRVPRDESNTCHLVVEKALRAEERLRIAAEVGSDLPLFLVGGTVLGLGRGEQVYPLEDLPAMACVVVTPEVGVSTPKAFAEWDGRMADR